MTRFINGVWVVLPVYPLSDGAHLGQPWSKMFIGRVRINNAEKWVGFIGGGYSGTDCAAGGTCDPGAKDFTWSI